MIWLPSKQSVSQIIILSGTLILLLLTQFLYGQAFVQIFSKKLCFVNNEVENKGMTIAILVEIKDTNAIEIVFEKELEHQGSEEKATCYFKVSE